MSVARSGERSSGEAGAAEATFVLARRRRGASAGLLALALLWPAAATAMDVELAEVPRVAFDGVTVRVAIVLVDPDEDLQTVTLAADPALQVRGPLSTGRTVSVINGERSISFPIHWEVTPTSTGEFSLGPVTIVTRSGKTQSAKLGSLRVLERAPPGSAKLLVKALEGGPVGYPFRVEYTLLTSEEPFEGQGSFGSARYPFGLEAIELTLFDAGLPWIPLAADASAEPVQLRVGEDRSLLMQESIVEHEGLGYHATRFALQVTPRKPGPVDLSAEATLQVVGGTKRVRTFFGGVQEVPAGRRVRVSAQASYLVADLPPNPPPGFTGAVGRYTVSASCAVREANAFDPIEVTIRVEGQGLLDDVVLPPWQDDEAISAEFQVATDVDPGKIVGDAKVFTKVFRARTARVKALPALPFPYFDPQTGRYAVARSAPLPLSIREVKTVTSADAVGPARSARSKDATRPSALVARDGIRANYVSLGDERAAFEPANKLGPLLWAGALLPPLLWGIALLAPWLLRKASGGPSPLAQALDAIEGGTLDAVRVGLHRYADQRLGLGGEVTAAELEQALRARVVAPETVERAVGLWRDLEAARFSGSGAVPTGAADVLRELDPCL